MIGRPRGKGPHYSMDDLRTFEFGADIELLKNAYETGRLPGHMEAPFRAMVTDIIAKVREKPVSIYLCSPEEDAEARNLIGFFLTRLVREHIPTVLLVDCDFLSVGMTGIIPHRDALGFLDLLLYGTSLGVISQEAAHGVRIIGAGSFPVAKKSPFAVDAFESARRYLTNQAKCVIFCGPVLDDEELMHPLVEAVDLAALVRMGDHFDPRFLDPFEEKISSVEGKEAWSVRLDKSIPIDETIPEFESKKKPETTRDKQEPTLVAEVEELVEQAGLVDPPDKKPEPVEEKPALKKPEPTAPMARAQELQAPRSDAPAAKEPMAKAPMARAQEPEAPKSDSPTARRRFDGSRVFRLAIFSVAVMLVVFVLWWLFLTKSVREREQTSAGLVEQPVASGDATVSVGTADSTRTDDAGAGESLVPAVADTVVAGRDTQEPSTGAGTEAEAETGAIPKPDRVEIAETLDPYANQYLIHVSSFRKLENAKDEAFYLLGWGYPVFIYRADLGSKGMWYRVYVGPSTTREEAMEHKIKLDENRRIKSTRIARVPG